ncbi:Uncharacterised protein [Candidatus Gugararchaeum adminiculabundum]|nr:Uncharacterised protein [Candidatus Gugararchaeum adminiculabundum]
MSMNFSDLRVAAKNAFNLQKTGISGTFNGTFPQLFNYFTSTGRSELAKSQLEAKNHLEAKRQIKALKMRFKVKLNTPVSETKGLIGQLFARKDIIERMDKGLKQEFRFPSYRDAQYEFDITSNSIDARLAALFDVSSARTAEEVGILFARRLELLRASAAQFFIWSAFPLDFVGPAPLYFESNILQGDGWTRLTSRSPDSVKKQVRDCRRDFSIALEILEHAAKETFPEAFPNPENLFPSIRKN